jgi:hypothetical protein
VVSVEAAAGRHAVTEAGPGRGPLLWHTNHGRYLAGAEPEADGTSAARGATLDAIGVPATEPRPSWFLDVLTGSPPGGVRSDPGPDGRGLTTLCTLVADLTAGEAVIAARSEPPVAIPLADLAEGNPRAQSNIETADRAPDN